MHYIRRLCIVAAIGTFGLGCGNPASQESRILVSDVNHTPVKRQSIGNCWIYAVGTWAESLHVAATAEVANLSESYWTYWHFYNQMVGSSIKEIQTGGNWHVATRIIEQHGYMSEGDFIPEEADQEMSWAQSQAESVVNSALGQGGELQDRASRTPAKVTEVLDRAFGVNMRSLVPQAKEASELVTGRNSSGQDITLADSISDSAADGWNAISYPVVYGRGVSPSARQIEDRKRILKRVMKAVNDYAPVVMSVYIDFNGLDVRDSSFKLEKIAEQGGPGRQGGHMVVLEDYVVDNAPDGHGGTMSIGEGNVADDLKEKALNGDVRYFKIKNSWGTNRADRGITDGYHKFYSNYLNLPFEMTVPSGSSFYSSALSQFILPPGY
jgi:hypothetical protein